MQEKRASLKKSATSPKSQTDFSRLDAMTDEEIDFSDLPEVSLEMFAKGRVRKGLKPVPSKSS